MAKGKITGTVASVLAVAANEYREYLVIQKTNATAIALGIGEAAILDEGILLAKAGDIARLCGAQARLAVYVIGNAGTATYQDGNIEVRTG